MKAPFRVKKIVKDSVAELEGLLLGAPTLINTQFLRVYKRDAGSEPLRSRAVP